MPEDIKQMLQEYREGKLSRREFIHRALVLTGSLAAATTLVGALAPATSYANLVGPNDPALISSDINYSSTDGVIIGA